MTEASLESLDGSACDEKSSVGLLAVGSPGRGGERGQMPVSHSGGTWWLGPWRGRYAEKQPGTECFLKGVPT